MVPETPLSYRGFLQQALDSNAVFSGGKHAVLMLDKVRPRRSASGLFYIVTGVFLLLGIIRLAFGKYFSDLFRAFLNPTLSQRQLKDQLSQTPFPAFLLNIFFSVSLGVYLFLILQLYDYIEVERPLYLVPVFIVLVAAIYLIKYLFLRLSGWLFGLPELLDGYIFTIYLVHKVLGVILLPFLLLLAFGGPELARSALYISLCLIVLLVGYRYLRIYNGLHNHIYFSKFHFFLYLCAFEIAPVLIVGKGVLIWLNGTS
ncbi:hypothetical protein GCM10023143_02640 [Compostibacter hankyongensis]|uniref:DUF4271 domain-containing protein n=1 Tax=Compostibacter hankyongensis TaxID=1007089 RepID=A0ABP8FDL4_9BACT